MRWHWCVQQKRSVLRGCGIVFSGVFPLARGRNYESHYLWRLAVELGATPSMVMDNFSITHLVIHPERLGTQKHVQVSLAISEVCTREFVLTRTQSNVANCQARSIPNVFIVCPEWILKCARSWSRVPEKDFLADEWKLKHAPPPPVVPQEESKPTPEAAASEVSAEEAPKEPSESLETITDANTTDSTAQPVPKPVVGILVKDGAIATEKEKKQVKFAESVVDSDRPKQIQQRLNRAKVLMRPRAAPQRPLPTGTVASGGTFDFLSKIKKIHEARKDSKAPTTSGPKQPADTSASKKAMKLEKPKKVCLSV